MITYIAITLYLLAGSAHLDQKGFEDPDACMAYGYSKTAELESKGADILYGACYPVQKTEA